MPEPATAAVAARVYKTAVKTSPAPARVAMPGMTSTTASHAVSMPTHVRQWQGIVPRGFAREATQSASTEKTRCSRYNIGNSPS